MRKVKIFSVFMSIILLCSTLLPSVSVSAAFTPKFALHSEGVYMVNLDTDIVIVSKNADKKLTPASTTKIMTALVALENIKDFKQRKSLLTPRLRTSSGAATRTTKVRRPPIYVPVGKRHPTGTVSTL